AFKSEDPFFVLEMETIVPTGYYHEKYIEEITLNNNGSLKVVAKDHDEKVIKDIEPLKITFKDDDINKFQNILTKQICKINESESNPERKLEEAMNVHLTDESKTVSGKEPNNERYTFIKYSLFEQIDSDDYESWQDKVFRHFDKLNKDKINEHLESIDEDMLYNIAYIR